MTKLFDIAYLTDWSIHCATLNRRIAILMQDMGFTYVGHGRHRRTYMAPNERYVLKFATSDCGLIANHQEHYLYHYYKNNPDITNGNAYYAPCRLIQGAILMMKAVYPIEYSCNLPSWTTYIDCQQVGELKNGKVVAYDFSLI